MNSRYVFSVAIILQERKDSYVKARYLICYTLLLNVKTGNSLILSAALPLLRQILTRTGIPRMNLRANAIKRFFAFAKN